MKRINISVIIFLLSSTLSFAQIGFKSVGVGFGTTGMNYLDDLTFGFSFGAGLDLGQITKELYLRPFLSYWHVNKNVSSVELNTSDFTINGDILYHISQTPIFIGSGIGINMISSDSYLVGIGKKSSNNTRLGINAILGTGYPLSKKIMLWGEGRYTYNSDFDYLMFMVALVYGL